MPKYDRIPFEYVGSSHSITLLSFNIEARVEIPTFGGEVDTEKLSNWLKQLDIYFSGLVY